MPRAGPSGSNLAVVRKGEYEGLDKKLADPRVEAPDFGPATFHPGIRRPGHRCARVPDRLQHHAQQHATRAHATRHRPRAAREGPGRAPRAEGPPITVPRAGISSTPTGQFPCGNCDFDGKRASRRPSGTAMKAHGYDLQRAPRRQRPRRSERRGRAAGSIAPGGSRRARRSAGTSRRTSGRSSRSTSPTGKVTRPGTCSKRRARWRLRAAWS